MPALSLLLTGWGRHMLQVTVIHLCKGGWKGAIFAAGSPHRKLECVVSEPIWSACVSPPLSASESSLNLAVLPNRNDALLPWSHS